MRGKMIQVSDDEQARKEKQSEQGGASCAHEADRQGRQQVGGGFQKVGTGRGVQAMATCCHDAVSS